MKDLGVNGIMTLKRISDKQGGRVLGGFIWLLGQGRVAGCFEEATENQRVRRNVGSFLTKDFVSTVLDTAPCGHLMGYLVPSQLCLLCINSTKRKSNGDVVQIGMFFFTPKYVMF